jgi:N-acetylglucosaminyldiphosphoundecaprenol N-acetyl-beta-D-mannosaminyltransferase
VAIEGPVRTARIDLLTVPIDILPEESIEEIVRSMTSDQGRHQIVFLTLRDLLRAKRNNEYRRCVLSASLVIPTTRSLLFGAKFLKKQIPVRYMPFDFLIKLLGALEKQSLTVYLFGGRPRPLQVAAGNIRDSFPGLTIVGRYSGYYRKEIEQDIILAIRKASPSLLLTGTGIPGNDLWIHRNRKEFNPGFYLWAGDNFHIFSGDKPKPPKEAWERGVEWIPETIRKPWRIVRVFRYVFYGILLLIDRISGR